MGLIRSGVAPTSTTPFSMSDIEKQAHAIILRAKSQAARILTEVQRIGEESKKEAIDQGRIEGRAVGHAEGLISGHAAGEAAAVEEHRASLTQLSQTMTTMLTDIDKLRIALESEAASSVIELAVTIARKVTRRAGLADATIVSASVSDALRMTVRATDVRIAVAPGQHETLKLALPKIQMAYPSLKHVAIIEDETVALGGCRITTDTGGVVDADLETQIDRIAKELLPD